MSLWQVGTENLCFFGLEALWMWRGVGGLGVTKLCY